MHGIGFQRDVLGARPATAWQLDAFGHDPQFPGMAADAGLTSSSWARGPFHQWGPMLGEGDVTRMQFSSEFEWISPSGRGLLTHYMPAHYSAGWWMDESTTLADAERATYDLFVQLKKVALTRNVLLPVGTDYTPPNKWVTDIHRDWNARYTWPRFVCAIPAEFFDAVRTEVDARGIAASPQTRDMNPIYTGKDVSYIDTKQANRAAENALLDAEQFAVFACLLAGASYPEAAFAKAWVQLAYGAHHDAITGSESDQVYLDLLTSWRDAWELGRAARDSSLALLSSAVDSDVVVWNPLAHNRSDHVRIAGGGTVYDDAGVAVPSVVENGSVRWLAADVPSVGWRSYRVDSSGSSSSWEATPGVEIANEHYRLVVDPARGGTVSSLVELSSGLELIAPAGGGNELAVYDEYSAHPHAGEGPWHLLPRGPVVGSCESPAEVSAFVSPVGQRVVVRGRIGELLSYTQTLTLYDGLPRVECSTVIDDFTGEDRLLRLRWPLPVAGAVPVSEVGDAVVGRGFALLHDASGNSVDTANHPWTLDNPAFGWFGLSTLVRIRVGAAVTAVSVAEVVAPTEESSAVARDLVVALARAGVTSTCSSGDRPRYGYLDVDSNLPDTRIVLGGPDVNAFTARVLSSCDPECGRELERQLESTGQARVFIPAASPLKDVWRPDADLRDARALPVLVIAGDLTRAVESLCAELSAAEITVAQDVSAGGSGFESRTVAMLNNGVPGFAVDTDGVLYSSLMRSCTGWPSGTWIDPPRRTAPDGSNFQLQHWTHTFEYAIVSGEGDWRDAEISSRSAEFNRPLLAARGGASGALPSSGSMLAVSPAGAVQLGALKAAGNPLTAGSGAGVDPATGVALRLHETNGLTTEVIVGSDVGAVRLDAVADLLEVERSRLDGPLRLDGNEIATVLARFEMPPVVDNADVPLAPSAEPAQPLYARYWLHNRGPAPLGGLPAVAHLHPHVVDAAAGSDVSLRLTVCSDRTDASLRGSVALIAPWPVRCDLSTVELAPGGFDDAALAVTVPPQTPAGLYPIRAQLSLHDVPDAWAQVVEDVCIVAVGEPVDDEVLRIVDGPSAVEVTAGETARLVVTVGTDARADLAVEAHLISPWGTWEWIGPASCGAVVPASGAVDLMFDVTPPVGLAPGRWWALVRVGGAGHLRYSPAVEVVVR